MKKLLLIIFTFFAFVFVGCNGQSTLEETTPTPTTQVQTTELETSVPTTVLPTTVLTTMPPTTASPEWHIALITDGGPINDRAFNESLWIGIKAFAEENEIAHTYFIPNEPALRVYEETIHQAIKDGANIIVTPGFLFESLVYDLQFEYPDIIFLLIDGQPHSEDFSSYMTTDNTTSVLFKEEQAGFLAGYAAVAEGYTNLGFMGGLSVPPIQRYGIGYIAGAYYAANELGYSISFPADRYAYLGSFVPDSTYTAQAIDWYMNGTDIIFTVAGGAGISVMVAAEDQGGQVIGVEVDLAFVSETVVTSAVKLLSNVVQQELNNIINEDHTHGGSDLLKGIEEDAIGLALGESFRFNNFTENDYQTILNDIKNQDIIVPNTIDDLLDFLEVYAGNPSIQDLIGQIE